MIKIIKQQQKKKKQIFFISKIGNFNLVFIDKIFLIPKTIKILIKNQIIFFESILGNLNLSFTYNVNFFFKNNYLMLAITNLKNKKSLINLYTKLLKIKLKGLLQGFKSNLILKGIGFKSVIENDHLILKLGFSHNIKISIPKNIKIISKTNNLIFSSIDLILLMQFVHYIRNYKKPEPYKGKGLLLKNEPLFQKEGKKTKK